MSGPDLLERLGERLARYLADARGRRLPVRRPQDPGEIGEALSAAVGGLTGVDRDAALDVDGLLALVEVVLERSVVTAHPRFFNQNFAGADPVAVAGDWLTAALNTNLATFEMAPVITVMELELLHRLAALVGWSPPSGVGPGHRPGTFVPGGAAANMHALLLARHRARPELATGGLSAVAGRPPLALLTSTQSHYSIAKAAAAVGFGRDHVRRVACDAQGRMRPEALEAAIAALRREGAEPCLVNATAGTTVLGAFDPLDAVAEICAAEGLWMHVDGCFGASALCSPRHRALLAGVERADSLAWDPHKMLGMTQQCSLLLVRDPAALREVFAGGADYLFQPDKEHAELDGGDLTLACARRADPLKLWLTWKARGDAGLAARVDRVAELTAYLAARVADPRDPRFALAAPPNPFNVAFWWVPPELRPLPPPHELGPDARARLDACTVATRARLVAGGETMVGYASVDGGPRFFRMLVVNPEVRAEDLDALLGSIDAAAAVAFD